MTDLEYAQAVFDENAEKLMERIHLETKKFKTRGDTALAIKLKALVR